MLIVSSGGVIGRYAADVLGAGTDTAIQLNLQTRNTGVTEIVQPAASSPRLVSFNAIPHLERPDRAQRGHALVTGIRYGVTAPACSSALPHQRHEVARVDRLRGLLDLRLVLRRHAARLREQGRERLP